MMRIDLLFTTLAILLAWAFLLVGDQAESLDITRITQGTIKEIHDNSVKIIEDFNQKEVQVAIDSNTVYDNVPKLTDLKAGDEVQIEYKINQNKSTAVTVTKLEAEN